MDEFEMAVLDTDTYRAIHEGTIAERLAEIEVAELGFDDTALLADDWE